MSIVDKLWHTPGYDVKAHLAQVQRLYEDYPLRTYDQHLKNSELYVNFIFKEGVNDLVDPVSGCFTDIMFENEIYRKEFKPIEDRDYLISEAKALSPKRAELATTTLAGFLYYLVNRLPSLEPSNLSAPLYTIAPNFPQIVDLIYSTFTKFHDDSLLFQKLALQLSDNLLQCSGIDDIKSKKRRISPLEYSGNPLDYLVKTPFYDLFNAQVPFAIPRRIWASHGIILAPPNHGKSQFLGSLVASFISENDDNSPSIFLLDPHGDLFNNLCVRVPSHRLILLNPDDRPPPLNFLDFGNSTEPQILQTFSYLMSSLSAGLSDKQGAIVPYLLKLLRKIPNASLETLRLIVDEKVKKPQQSLFFEFISTLPQVDQGFFHTIFYHSSMDITKQAIAWKIYSAMSSDAFRQMFSAPTNSVNFDQLIADRKVVLVKGGRHSLGDDGMRIFLQFMIAQYFAAGLRRDRIPPDQRHLCIMFVDEAHTVVNSPVISNIFTELRKYGCGWCGATQLWSQIAEDVKSAVLGATAIKIAGPVAHSDAVVLSRDMGQRTTVDFIRSMKAVERSHADWAIHVQGLTESAVRIRAAYGAVEKMPIFEHPPTISVQKQPKMDTTHKGSSKPEPLRIPTRVPAEADKPIVATKPEKKKSTGGSAKTPGGWMDC